MPIADYGRDESDKRLKALEKEIYALYKEAADGLEKTIREYFDSFQKRDAEMQERLKAGEITEEYYKQWRLNQIARGKRFEALRDKIAERMTNANEVAAAYINDRTPGIYSLNANYTAYTIEQIYGQTDFTLWNEQAVRRLAVENPEVMPYYPPERAIERGIDLAWGQKQIKAVVTSSILRGQSLKGMVSDLMERIPTMERASAIRAARTAFTSAENGGRQAAFERAAEMGIQARKRWVATKDKRTRRDHANADGQTVPIDQPFDIGGYAMMYPGDPDGPGKEVYNCFPGYVKVASDSEAIRSYKHMYYGRLVTVKTAGGVEFTCTPNHPILTPDGWVRAESLNDGDNLVVTFVRDYAFSGRYPNIDHRFSRFDAFHELMNKFGGERTRALGVNFHGDVATTYVEIVTKKRFLRYNRNPSGRKRIANFFLEFTNKALSCASSFVKHFWSICKPALCNICGKSIFLSFFFGHLGHSDVHRFRPSSNMNVVLPEYSINDTPTATIIRSELLCGLSGNVFLDKIISVEVGFSDCHVYNLQTQNGYYFVNSSISQSEKKCNGMFAIAKNCRCAIRTVEGDDIEAEPRQMRVRDPQTGRNVLVNEMTYAEWERWVESRGV